MSMTQSWSFAIAGPSNWNKLPQSINYCRPFLNTIWSVPWASESLYLCHWSNRSDSRVSLIEVALYKSVITNTNLWLQYVCMNVHLGISIAPIALILSYLRLAPLSAVLPSDSGRSRGRGRHWTWRCTSPSRTCDTSSKTTDENSPTVAENHK